MANGEGHRILTHAALEALPAWEKDMLAAVESKLENEYCMYGDDYFGDIKNIGPYVELPDGRLPMDPWEIRHFRKDAPGKDYYTCGYYDLMRYSFEYFAGQCIRSIKSDDIAAFAKFAGSLAHVIEDCGAPPHAVGTTIGTDMKMIKLLYPGPDTKKMAAQFHCILESKFEPFEMEYRPRLQGVSPAEISFNMLERFTDMLENSISFIIPILKAFYSDDNKSLAAILTECGKHSSEILADFIHSTIAVGTGRIDKNEAERLTAVSLSEFTPIERSAWAPSPYPYAEIRRAPWNLNRQYAPVPLCLLIEGAERIFKKGFGLGPPFEMTYLLPEGVYNQFISTVGISSRLGTETGMTFEVFGDSVLLAQEKCLTVNDSRTISCDISGTRKIILKIRPEGDVEWPGNSHAVWGEPQLLK